jgi:hypothetical protein
LAIHYNVRAFLLCATSALLAGAVYANALRNPFVYDDHRTIVANASIHDVTNLRAIVLHDVTRPLVNFSYAVDRALWGPRPFGFHLDSVLLHMLNVALLFRLAWRLAQDGRRAPQAPAFAASALFAVHPMMTEAVGYISGRSELLVTAWFLAGLLAGRRWIRGGGTRWALLTLGCWIAALASKETAAMFPFVLFGMDWLAAGPRPGSRDAQNDGGWGLEAGVRIRAARLYLPMMGLAVAGGLGRLLVLRFEYPDSVAIHREYILVELDVLRRYIALMLRPAGQTMFHAVPAIDSLLHPRALAAIALVAAIVALAWRIRRAAGIASLGIAWFLLGLAPSAVLAVLDQGEPMAEHRVYLASAGFFLAAGIGISHADAWLQRAGHRMRWAGGAMMAVVIVSLSAMTLLRNAVWADPVALWQESVDLAPAHYRPRLLLGEALEDAGRRVEAIEQYRTAIRLQPADPDGYMKLGLALAAAGRLAEARQILLQALEVDPADERARKALGLLDQISPSS